MKKTSFKIHVSNQAYHTVLVRNKPKTKNLRKKTKGVFDLVIELTAHVLFLVGDTVFGCCYFVGEKVIQALMVITKAGINHLTSHRKRITTYRSLMGNRQFQISLAVFFFLALTSFGIFKSAKIVALGLELKRKVVGMASTGAGHLLEAQRLAEAKNVEGAQNQFVLALQSFKTSKEQFDQTSSLVRQGLELLPQKHDADRLLSGASYISKSGVELVNFYNGMGQLKISPQGLSAETPVKDILNEMSAQLESSASDLKTANEKISAVSASSLPANYAATFGEIKTRLSTLQKSLNNINDLFSIAKGIALGKKKILFLFENNNELRAAGGFIGTYGDADVLDGQITKLKIGSIYDLDGQLKEKILPPTPLLNVGDRWYMRDSNWFANFPDSAKKVSSFFEKEGGETPDMVIALTPSLIIDLLKITGPIDMPAYKVTLNAENFVEITQIETSVNYDKNANTPKQMLADFFPVLLQHISALPKNGIEQAVISLQKNLNGKQLVFYSRDSFLQKQLESFNWTGSLTSTDRDYLSVINSNLGGTKTDLSMEQTVNLNTTIDQDGSIVNHLTITRKNLLPQLDETPNMSFVRIYVPKGSQLISNNGFDRKNLDSSEFKDYKTDPSVLEWEKSTVKDVTTGTLIGQESGKTFFGNWLTVNGGDSRTIELTYKLPFTLNPLDHFSLVVQKQIGSNENLLNYHLHFGNRILEWQNMNTDNLEGNTISESLKIDKDYFLGAVLNKK
jgi:hypothetical protein